jgi:hypothetical protein
MEVALSIAAIIAALLTYGVYLFEKWIDDNEKFI